VQEEAMTYPTAIVIAAALLAGAVFASSHGAASSDEDGVALAVVDDSTVWVGRDGGAIRVCRLDNRGTAQLGIQCSEWVR
jgi:hypothetical protein